MIHNTRRTTMVVVALALIAGFAYAGVDIWTSTGPWGGKAAWIYISGGTVHTELTAGLFKSTDDGVTWELSYDGIPHDTRAMWCHNNYSAAFPNIMYGGT